MISLLVRFLFTRCEESHSFAALSRGSLGFFTTRE